MFYEPENVVVGNYSPVKDPKTKKQIVTKEGRKWLITASLPKHYDKKQVKPRKYLIVYGPEKHAKKEMQDFVVQLNKEINQRFIPNKLNADMTKISFKEYLLSWLQISRKRLKRKTWESYCLIAHKHIFPLMGHILLKEINPYHISLYKERKLVEVSASTVNKHLSVMSGALKNAASPEKKLIPFNPVALVERAADNESVNKVIENCLKAEDLNSLLNKLYSLYSLRRAKSTGKNIKKLKKLGFTSREAASPKALFKLKTAILYPIVYLAAKTGMRLSELLALKWNNIDFRKREIQVILSSHYGKIENGEDPHHYNSTKEGKPKSVIDITQKDIDFLKEHRKEQLKLKMVYRNEYHDNDLVFARNNGTHLRNSTVSNVFTDFAQTNGFDITFHGLRHTHLTLLASAGVPMMYVARRAGHQKVSTTHDFYSHAEKTKGFNLGEIFENELALSQVDIRKNINSEMASFLDRII